MIAETTETPISPDFDFDILRLLANTQAEARPYQQRIINKVVHNLSSKERGGRDLRSALINSPTGSGKTVIVLLINKAIQDREDTLNCWISMRRNLLAQAAIENGIRSQVNPTGKSVCANIDFISMFEKNLPDHLLPDNRGSRKLMLTIDEAQHDAANSMAHIHARLRPDYIVGMSVGGDSMVLVKDDNGNVRHTRIDDFIDRVIGTPDDRITYVDNWSVRAFDGTAFVWKKLKSVIRHCPGDKKTYRIKTDKGRSLLITEDHSVYRVVEGQPVVVDKYNNTRPSGIIEEAKGDQLNVGDWLLLEDSIPETKTVQAIDMTTTVTGDNWKVAGDFGDWVEQNITETNGYKDANKVRYTRRNGKYGTYLSASEYRLLEQPNGIIYYSGNGNHCQVKIKIADIAYILGFYIGNGWVDGNQVIFAANDRQLPFLSAALEQFSQYADLGIDIKPSPSGGDSFEVTVNNKTLADWFKATVGGRAWEKQIPDLCFNISTDNVRLVVAGLLATDGSLQKPEGGRSGRWVYTTTSAQLVTGLCELLKRLGPVASVYRRKSLSGGIVDGRQIVGKHVSYSVHFHPPALDDGNPMPAGSHTRHFVKDFAGVPVRIRSIEEESTEYVYDFSVDDDKWQSFVANGFAVHNTATPFRTDRMKLCFDSVINDAGIGALIHERYLSKYEHYTIPKWDVVEATTVYLREPKKWGKSIFYFHTLEQCAEATARLREGGIKVEMVTGNSNRDDQLERFRTGVSDVIVNCMVLTEGFDCLSEDSEILTDKGWVGYGDVGEGDKCYSLNRQTGRMELTRIDAYNERPLRSGERMISVKSQHLDLLTTEGHEYHIRYRDPHKKGVIEERLKDGFVTLTAGDLLEHGGEFQLPLAAEMEFEGILGITDITDDAIRLIAWAHTDGGLTPSGALEISQSEKETKHADHIRSLLNRLGVTYSEGYREPNTDGTGHGFETEHGLIRFYVHASSIIYLREFMMKSDMSSLQNMTRRQFMVFWDELMLGNGSKAKPKAAGWLWLPTEYQADTLQAMAVIRGLTCSKAPFVTDSGLTVYRISARDTRWMGIRSADERAARIATDNTYAGRVWCVKNRNSTIVVRRNGKVAIIGNCPDLETAFLRPSCKGVTIQMAGRVFRIHPNVPVKKIVQCERTKWPFIRTAEPVISYRWETARNGEPGQWLSLTPNPHINELNCRMLGTLMGINTVMPKFIQDKRKNKREKRKERL